MYETDLKLHRPYLRGVDDFPGAEKLEAVLVTDNRTIMQGQFKASGIPAVRCRDVPEVSLGIDRDHGVLLPSANRRPDVEVDDGIVKGMPDAGMLFEQSQQFSLESIRSGIRGRLQARHRTLRHLTEPDVTKHAVTPGDGRGGIKTSHWGSSFLGFGIGEPTSTVGVAVSDWDVVAASEIAPPVTAPLPVDEISS